MAADVVVFVKAPRAGTVKTRLARSLGRETACRIYKTLLTTLLETLSSIPQIEVRFSPDDAQSEIAPWLQTGWHSRPQGPGDLGEKMLRAFTESFGRGASKVIVIGSDCPEITAADLDDAARALSSHDVVLGPAADGGYWLIGLTKVQPDLFRGISWSSAKVLAETVTRATALGLRVHALRILNDIDTVEDWKRYQRAKGLEPGTPAPN